eukprot:1738876-Rhodomonas_salina.2
MVEMTAKALKEVSSLLYACDVLLGRKLAGQGESGRVESGWGCFRAKNLLGGNVQHLAGIVVIRRGSGRENRQEIEMEQEKGTLH